ncbi:MAG: hypothetical protein ACREFZ_07730, partial [Acetobacteraceae bacterium]
MTRRRSLLLGLTLPLLAAGRPALAADRAAGAKAFIKKTGDAILAVENTQESAAARRAQLER